MSYSYKPRTAAELRATAQHILAKYPTRRTGAYAVDIEGISEDLNLEIIYRPWSLPYSAYAAQDPRYLLINELDLGYLPRFRFSLAEEVCHRILEWRLWNGEPMPDDAHCQNLSQAQYEAIERDAKSLAAEILMPYPIFMERFAHHKQTLSGSQPPVPELNLIRRVTRELAMEFDVSPMSAGVRASKLRLITSLMYKRCYPIIM